MTLSVKDHMRLQFEDLRWKYPGTKEAAIRDIFGESSTIHYAAVHRLLDDPAALEHYPQTVRRLRRLRDQWRAARRAG